jgi:transcriptional regulator with XRE-family HTH domain
VLIVKRLPTIHLTHLVAQHRRQLRNQKSENFSIARQNNKNNIYFCQKLTSQMKETFGEYIKQLRTEHDLTLTQLAAKLELDSANLSKIENNKRKFDGKRLILLADIFDLDISVLRTEFFSDIIAKKLYENNCDNNTLILAEQKVKYLKSKKLTTI